MSLVFKPVSLLDSDKENIRSITRTAKRFRGLIDTITIRLNSSFKDLLDSLSLDGNMVEISYNEVSSDCKVMLVKDNVVTDISCYSPTDVCYSGQVNRNFMMETTENLEGVLARYGSTNSVIKSVSNSGTGALEFVGYNYYIGDDFIPVDRSKEYRINFIAEGMMVDGSYRSDIETRHYGGLACYDNDKKFISVHHVYARPGTYSYMVDDVKKGDKFIKIAGDISAWYQGGINHMRSVMIHKLRPDGTYGYIGLDGKHYSELGYSRYGRYNFFIKNGLVDNGDGTFTMELRYTAPEDYSAGTRINNSASGGSYNYWMSWWGMPMDGELYQYKSPWKNDSMDKPSRYYWGIMRDGTSYFKTMGLFTYRTKNSVTLAYISSSEARVKIHRYSLEARNKD